ncbi:hypothetical protein C4D60_Mb11t18920 [Musa balbisiana]|uniref:Uncharacterized protein n=1 Tax=Musa balbisiana TaxID=52838 RepID=A0A4S8J548_MUSBA|nr:hypothetical protein C4D60_Mb11t18920 [Musa balbisiana]
MRQLKLALKWGRARLLWIFEGKDLKIIFKMPQSYPHTLQQKEKRKAYGSSAFKQAHVLVKLKLYLGLLALENPSTTTLDGTKERRKR